MPLDPYVQGFLQQLAEAGRPKIWQLDVADARRVYSGLAHLADAKDVAIGKVEEHTLAGPANLIPIRVYTPVGAASESIPGFIFFHGGGCVVGDVESYDGLCRLLSNASGCRLVSVEYRLAPEHKFPAAVEDAVVATRGVMQNAAALGIDAERVAIGGDSTGGGLAAVVCQLATAAGGPKLALQVLICPMLDAAAQTESRRLFGEGYFLETKTIEHFAALYYASEQDAKDPRASPLLSADLSGLPPALVHTAEYDPVRDEGQAYAARLRLAGVETSYVCHEGLIHHFYGMAGINPTARKAVEGIGAAIKAALG